MKIFKNASSSLHGYEHKVKFVRAVSAPRTVTMKSFNFSSFFQKKNPIVGRS